MFNPNKVFLKIFIVIFTVTAAVAAEEKVVPHCDCPNPVYVDKPNNRDQCKSASIFRKQVEQNFEKIFSELKSQSKKHSCDLSHYRSQVVDLKSLILKIVDAFFECNDDDCTATVQKAIDKYVALRFPFAAYARCALALFSPDCARLLFQVRPLVFSSAENIIAAMLTCAGLKSGKVSNVGSGRLLSPPECNCVKISYRPSPSNEKDCFSKKFLSKLKDFIATSYKYIRDDYNNSPSKCDVGELRSSCNRIEKETYKFVDIINGSNQTFAAIDQAIVEYRAVVIPYTDQLRDYILTHTKKCYFIPRQARNNPIAIGDWTIAVAKYCIVYKDSSKLTC